jgi:hypothetical protein
MVKGMTAPLSPVMTMVRMFEWLFDNDVMNVMQKSIA